MSDYYLCGWRVRSQLPLPELVAWSGDDGRAVDIHIRLGKVGPRDPAATVIAPVMEVSADGACRLAIDDAAHFLVRDGREVTVEPKTDPGSSAIRLYLLGTVLALLCHQRKLLPLHASCVRWGDGAVAFVGVSGAGKSTMAAALRERGHIILSDDVCVIDLAGGAPMVRPAFPRVKLWPDSMQMLGLPGEGAEPDHQAEKYHFRFTQPGAFEARPAPLRAIYLLKTAPAGTPAAVEPIEAGGRLMTILRSHVPRLKAAIALGREPGLFAAIASVVAVTPVRRLIRSAEPDRIGEGLEVLAQSLASQSLA